MGLVLVLVVIASIHTKNMDWASHILPNDPGLVLMEANRLAWLDNWYAAGRLYKLAEEAFRTRHDSENALYACIGRLRSESFHKPLTESVAALSKALDRAGSPQLRLWGLAQRAALTIDADPGLSKRDWSEVLSIAENQHEAQWAARAQGALGTLAFLDGNTALAVSDVGKSILAAYKTGDTGSQIRMLAMLGLGFNEEARYSEALLIFQHAIETATQTPDAGFPFLAYEGQAAALAGLGRITDAQDVLNKTIAAARQRNDRLHETDLKLQIAEVEVTINHEVKAEEMLHAVVTDAVDLDYYRSLESALFDLAGVDKKLGRGREATQTLLRAVRVSSRLSDHYYIPRDLTAMAEISVAEGKFRSADRLFRQAEDTLDSILVRQHSFEESVAHAGAMSPIYLEHFRLAVKMGDVARAFGVLERVRGRTVASKLVVQNRNTASSPRIAELQGNIAATQLKLLQNEGTQARDILMTQLLENERKLAFEVNEAGLQTRDLLANPTSLRLMRETLRDDEVLAEYVLDEPNAFCIAVTKRHARVVILPAGNGTIQSLALSYLSQIKARGSGDAFAKQLYSLLLAPVLSAVPKSRIIVSADGILNAVPFESLKTDQGYVLASHTVSYIPSGTVLAILRSHRRPVASQALLAVGAVDYAFARSMPRAIAPEKSVAAVAIRGLEEFFGANLQDLPGSREEVNTIAGIMGSNTTLLLGNSATEAEFKAQPLRNFGIIHLATHASSDVRYPDRAALLLGTSTNSTEDGLLQLREIMHLSLNAELVTLSACETGVGPSQGEAGIVNLEQAFLIAGARTVVASLWNVEDNSTITLMKAFYMHLSQGEDKDLALANAKREILAKYGDVSPYYWAGFIAVGQTSEPIWIQPRNPMH
jgi:CHAT domain-containing protein